MISKRMQFYQSHSRYWLPSKLNNKKPVILSETAKSIIRPTITPKTYDEDKQYDLVYIVKASEYNPDLQMSLRSVAKFCDYRNIWIIGYKPTWVKNTNHIATKQNQDKWKNSITNYLAACNCPEISENFILMNDDFFALKPIRNWRTSLNVCLGTLEEEVEKNKDDIKKSRWKYGFDYALDILNTLNCKNTYNYEAHLPIIINKQNFLNMMNLPIIREFMTTKKVLHKRSMYKNLYPEYSTAKPKIISDVKITIEKDLDDSWLQGEWLSVFDNTVSNHKQFPILNNFLYTLFPSKCKYEK